jgi:methyltransferase (TIGR00027 family)
VKDGRPSATALAMATYRAAHRVLDAPPYVLDDPIAIRLLPPEVLARLRPRAGSTRARIAGLLRAWTVARSRLAEDELARATARGTAQYVVLGAGLDSFAYRQPSHPRPLQVYEVDFPATQTWKRARLAAAGLSVPDNVSFVATDFAKGRLAEDLRGAGFSWDRPAFFSWLGVTMYLTPETVERTLRLLAAPPPGGGLVLDYFQTQGDLPVIHRAARSFLGWYVARSGEPFQSTWPTGGLARRILELGFRAAHDVGPAELNERYFRGRSDGLRVQSGSSRLLVAER